MSVCSFTPNINRRQSKLRDIVVATSINLDDEPRKRSTSANQKKYLDKFLV